MPLAVDLCCGLGGWTEGLMAEGWRCRGYDIEAHEYDGEKYLGELVLKSILDLHGSEVADSDLIVASPPCTEYSYMAMPWSRAKQIARALRGEDTFPKGYRGSRTVADLNALFDACFRIQREASEAAGRHIPMIVENVRGAQPWVGRAAANYGSFYFWGDVPALMPTPRSSESVKAPGLGAGWVHPSDPRHQPGLDFTRLAGAAADGRKVPGFRFDGSGRSFQTASVEGMKAPGGGHIRDGAKSTFRLTNPAEGRKGAGAGAGAEWFDQNLCQLSSKSSARKAASARIAKIPFALSSWVGKIYKP